MGQLVTTDDSLTELSKRVGEALHMQGITLATAESCTGGWIAEVVTQTAGSSAWFECGFVTYSNGAKIRMLGVSPRILATHGAVSEQTANAMARGALANCEADVVLSVTGIAGPGGGTTDKPVGTVSFAWCRRGGQAVTATRFFDGDRAAVRRQSVVFSLENLLAQLASAE